VMKQVNDELDAARKTEKREAEKLKNKSEKERVLSGLTKSKWGIRSFHVLHGSN